MTTYDLVFEGGGAKGFVFVGALQVLEAQNIQYSRLLGTSAGAISATLLAAGYTVAELLAALNEQEDGRPIFATFMANPTGFDETELLESATLALLQSIDLPLVSDRIEESIDTWLARMLMERAVNLFSLVERGGWYSAERFMVWLRRKLDASDATGRPRNYSNLTMHQFFEATGRDLSVVTSDTIGGRMLVLNHRTTPDLPVTWAVRMSMSIPLLWPDVEWQPEWGDYHLKGKARSIVGNRMVDGGVLSNFPIELFLCEEPHITAVMGESVSDRVLGLMIDEKLPVDGTEMETQAEADSVNFSNFTLIQRIRRLVETTLGAHDKMVVDTVEDSVVRLPAKGYSLTEFAMLEDRRDKLIAAGRQAMQAYFERQAQQAIDPDLSFGIGGSAEDEAAIHAKHVASRMFDW